MSDDLVLVSGASGFIGSHVVRALQEAGYKVRGTVRDLKNEKKVGYLHKLCPRAKYPLELVEADLLESESWPKAVSGCRYVVHTASPLPMITPKNAEDVIKPAVEGTMNVLRAASEAKTVKRVVVTSSFAASLDSERTHGEYTEEDWSIPDKQIGPYYRSKTLAERAAWNFIKNLPEEQKFELCVVNPVLVIGPPLSSNPATSIEVIAQMMERRAGPLVAPLYFPMVDVRDVAEAHVKCLTTDGAVGNRHLLAGETIYLPDVANWLDKEFRDQDYSIATRPCPGIILSAASLLSPQVKAMKELGSKPKQVSNQRMREVLGITPRSIESSIIELGYSLVEVGLVKRTDKYKGPASEI